MCYNIIGDNMRVEKWIYKNKEIDVPILEEDEIETNEDIDYLENTVDLTKTIEDLGDKDDK